MGGDSDTGDGFLIFKLLLALCDQKRKHLQFFAEWDDYSDVLPGTVSDLLTKARKLSAIPDTEPEQRKQKFDEVTEAWEVIRASVRNKKKFGGGAARVSALARGPAQIIPFPAQGILNRGWLAGSVTPLTDVELRRVLLGDDDGR